MLLHSIPSTWPFALESTVQPMALTVFRPLPIEVVGSSINVRVCVCEREREGGGEE